MKKRGIGLLLVLCMLMSMFTAMPMTASAATSGTCGSNLTWTLDDNGALTISGTGDMWDWNYDNRAPWNDIRNNVKTAIIEIGVTSIDSMAFYDCDSLTNVSISSSITSIGDMAFRYCSSLTSINVDIGNQYYSSLNGNLYDKNQTLLIQYAIGKKDTSFSIPNSVTSIGDSAFWSCDNLTSISIPNSVTSIGDSAFEYCRSLKDVYYSGSEAQWEKISIGSGNACLAKATIHFDNSMLTPLVYLPPEKIAGNMNFASGNGSAAFDYNDLYFNQTSYEYNHGLAKASIRLALSAFAKHENGNRYGNQYANVRDFLNKLNFINFEKNEWYSKAPSQNSIGVAIAEKGVAMPNADYTALPLRVTPGLSLNSRTITVMCASLTVKI